MGGGGGGGVNAQLTVTVISETERDNWGKVWGEGGGGGRDLYY